MSDDLDPGIEPDPRREVRLRFDDGQGRARLRVSLWLPADAEAAAIAMRALAEAGLDFDRGPFRSAPHPRSAELRRLAADLDFYAASHDGSPELVRAAGVELRELAVDLIRGRPAGR